MRPCFDVTWVHGERMFKPVNKNSLCLFTISQVMLSAREVVSL